MNNILKIKTLFGIEEILKLDNIFKQLLNDKTFDEIHVSICEITLKNCRDTYDINTFKEKYYIIMKYIFNDERIIITNNQDYTLISSNKLCVDYNKEIIFKIREDLITNKLELPKNFITVHTKVLSLRDNQYFGKSMYEKYSNIFLETLKKYSGTIILLGERKIKYCAEYDKLDTFSIYNDIKILNNIIDYTIDNSEENNNLIELLNSFEIINKGDLNILLSFSGIRTICLFFSENILGVKYEDDNHFHQYKEHNFKHINKNINLHYTYDDYINNLKNKIENLNKNE